MFSIRMNKVLQGFVCLMLTHRIVGYPMDCKEDQDGTRCPSISLDKLLDRIIQHAELIYRVSEESCTLFEEMYIPSSIRAQLSRGGNACSTRSVPIQGRIQQISDKWLLHSTLVVIQSWTGPLQSLQITMDLYDNAPDGLLNKTKWMSTKLMNLEQGVTVLIRKMLNEDILVSDPSQNLTHFATQPNMVESVLTDYTLLTCFRKDAHRVETFLKLLKCRQSDRLSCFLY
uniref:Somatolactin n=1 Tax=Anguilla anguilla TaxID=7936 RepID=SOML_ANGAN|nr:RecName: Full=Somatolactin; Short=SL; Flags: Precursor [Anguilla anguilla]AAB53035.1 somatolactin precursor [Anguilla anguilla]